MKKYQNLQNSASFKAMPSHAQTLILSKDTLAEACAELQVQIEENFHETHKKIEALVKNGEDIDAISAIGQKGKVFEELSESDQAKVIELDPAKFHPESLKLTPKGKASAQKFHALLSSALQ